MKGKNIEPVGQEFGWVIDTHDFIISTYISKVYEITVDILKTKSPNDVWWFFGVTKLKTRKALVSDWRIERNVGPQESLPSLMFYEERLCEEGMRRHHRLDFRHKTVKETISYGKYRWNTYNFKGITSDIHCSLNNRSPSVLHNHLTFLSSQRKQQTNEEERDGYFTARTTSPLLYFYTDFTLHGQELALNYTSW